MGILRKNVDRDCPVCHRNYKADSTRLKHGRQTTCSRQCSYEFRAQKVAVSPVKSTCPVCLSDFGRTPSHFKNSQAFYCSTKCAYRGRTLGLTTRRVTKPYNITKPKQPPVLVQCLECGGRIETVPSLKDRRKFCSKLCQSTHQKNSMKGESNPSWVDGRSYNKRCYRGDDWDTQRKEAYKRDNYECQCCGVKCIGRQSMN